MPWFIAGACVLALVMVVALRRPGHAAVHPDPRPGIGAERVLPPSLVPDGRGVIEAYAAARNAPQILGSTAIANAPATSGTGRS